jgi:hypothetical protein
MPKLCFQMPELRFQMPKLRFQMPKLCFQMPELPFQKPELRFKCQSSIFKSQNSVFGLIRSMKIFDQLGLSKLVDTQFWQYETFYSARSPVAICKLQAKRASLDHTGLTEIFFGYLQDN